MDPENGNKGDVVGGVGAKLNTVCKLDPYPPCLVGSVSNVHVHV